MSQSTIKEEQSSRQKIVTLLSTTLADTYILYVKTQNFHWNVEDPRFYFLHKMLEDQYVELADAIDTIAEQIRALNFKAPASLKKFLELTELDEASETLDAKSMLQQLFDDHMALANRFSPWIKEIQDLGDEGSADLLIQRLRSHQKTAWMLRSHLEKSYLS